MAVKLPVAVEAHDHCHVTPTVAPSGSLSVAVSAVPACGRPDESATVPASSALVTSTVTSTVSSTAVSGLPLRSVPSDTSTVTE